MRHRYLAASAFVFVIGSCVAEPRELTPAERAAKDSADREFEVEVAGMASVKSRLRDPESARFNKVTVQYFSGSPVLCGLINAKNGFGGYAGEESFMVVGNTAIMAADMSPSRFIKEFGERCLPPHLR